MKAFPPFQWRPENKLESVLSSGTLQGSLKKKNQSSVTQQRECLGKVKALPAPNTVALLNRRTSVHYQPANHLAVYLTAISASTIFLITN